VWPNGVQENRMVSPLCNPMIKKIKIPNNIGSANLRIICFKGIFIVIKMVRVEARKKRGTIMV
jgi:hypothetical protein